MSTATATATASAALANTASGHWRLVGPWYRWPRPALPEDGRLAAPAIQKFAGNSFAADFLARPQHSLAYDPVIDVVQNHDLVSAKGLAGKIGTLFALTKQGDPAPDGATDVYRARLAPSGLRKLYQPTHDRHYIVTCELHCDEPGFPRVERRKVCQAGFVVRRRRSIVPAGVTAGDIEAQAAVLRQAEATLYELDVLAQTANDPLLTASLRAGAAKRQLELANNAGLPTWDALIAQQRSALVAKRAALQAWYRQAGITVAIDGWFPQPGSGGAQNARGAWQALADDTARSADVSISGEQTYPLYALVPDPRDAAHDAAARTMYHGIVPTADLQHDTENKPHFDDLTTYELRCFVRAHHACPPRAGKQPDCHGGLAWSLPSEAFRVAAPFDILGSANRPVTIKMPDLRDLAAQAALRPRGRLSPVRFVQPQHLSPNVVDGKAEKGSAGGAAICSFSIPLITIIALFVLNLFLPIVVFIFQLWFLLVFRFCVPPSVQIAGKADAALAATPPGVDLDADFAVSFNGAPKTADQLNSELKDAMAKLIKASAGTTDTPTIDKLGNNALGPLDQSMFDAAALEPNADGSLPEPPAPGEPLVYVAPVVPLWPASVKGAA